MMEAAEQDFKYESKEDFFEKCKNPEQKDAITKFLHTDDSYYCDLEIDAESIDQVNDPDIKLLLILRLSIDDFKKVVDKLINEYAKKLIEDESYKKDDKFEEEEKDDYEKINSEESTLTFDYFLRYFLTQDFNKFSLPIEISQFIAKCIILNNEYRLIFQDYFENQFEKLFNEENFDIHNYFYTDRKNRIKIMHPKQEFFDLCVEKELGVWTAYTFTKLPRSKQTKKNFLKIPDEFQVSALAILYYISWKLLDCLSTEQKQELVDKKIITKEHFLNKKVAKICLAVATICSAIALAGLISFCIFAPVLGPIVAPVLIALYALGTFLGSIATFCSGHDLYKINKFNEEIEIEQSKTEVPSNDTNDPILAAEVKAEPQPPMGANQIEKQNLNNKEP